MKIQDSFTTKNKAKIHKKNPFNAYKENKPNIDDKLSEKINIKKTLASSSTSYHHKKSSTLSNIKPIYSYKETLNKAYSKLNSTLHSYNPSIEEINKKIINDIIFDEDKRIVSIFKDYLLWYETSDFFKQYYKKNKSIKLMIRFINYYINYTYFFPIYSPLEDIINIMRKNAKKKKKYFERLAEDEEKQATNEKDKKFERIIKESEIKINKTNSKISNFQKNNSKSTLILDSIDKEINKNTPNNNDFYLILKNFIDYDDITFDKKEEENITNRYHNNNNHIINGNDNDKIFIFNSKLSKYFKKSFNEEKNKKTKKERIIIIDTKIKNKKFISISPNIKSLNNKINQNNRIYKKEENFKKSIDKKNNYKKTSLKKYINPLINYNNQTSKINNHRYLESNSSSKYKNLNTHKTNIKTNLILTKPHNIKKIFTSYNKYDNSAIGNYYTLFSYRSNTELNSSRKSPNSLMNYSPINMRMNTINSMANSMRNKKTNNYILNFEKLKNLNNIKSLRLSTKINNNYNFIKNKDLNCNDNVNKINKKVKYKKILKNSGKENSLNIKVIKERINTIENKSIFSLNKKKRVRLNTHLMSNPFIINNNSNINKTINQNNYSKLNNLNLKQNEPFTLTEYNNYKDAKTYSKNISKKKDNLKVKNNNLILIKSHINNLRKNNFTNSSNKKNNKVLLTKKNSLLIKKNINNNNITIKKNKINNNSNNNYNMNKNNIDKTQIKNKLKINIKLNNNSILKSCFTNINNYTGKKNIQKSGYYDKKNNDNKDYSIKKFSILNFDENSLLKNKIKKKQEININKSGLKKARICLRLPINNKLK